MYELVIIGGGPCGIAAAVEAQRRGLRYLALEQGSLCSSLTKYPIYMTFASSPENLELGLDSAHGLTEISEAGAGHLKDAFDLEEFQQPTLYLFGFLDSEGWPG
ncbi:MAG TPA: NAD(P)-binding domain-containing protein, partial [Symbiobacteriaceae bacterium]|nr:NAD(P)-binding domain-containing protein [Symbiobacteriaceae bacterium]